MRPSRRSISPRSTRRKTATDSPQSTQRTTKTTDRLGKNGNDLQTGGKRKCLATLAVRFVFSGKNNGISCFLCFSPIRKSFLLFSAFSAVKSFVLAFPFLPQSVVRFFFLCVLSGLCGEVFFLCRFFFLSGLCGESNCKKVPCCNVTVVHSPPKSYSMPDVESVPMQRR